MQLGKNEVHIYTADLTLTPDQQQRMMALLNEEERARAMRFVAPIHQQRFIAAHALLRQLLASYLNTTPESIAFTHSAHRKPSLALHHESDIQFNISHTGQHAAYAFTRRHAIGIDIESFHSDPKLDVAERFFSPSEVATLKAASSEEQPGIFYRLWSRKEAIIKANGKGLTQPLSSFSVPAVDHVETLTLEGETWYLYPLSVHPDFAAAVAIAAPAERLAFWEIIDQQPIFKTTL